MIDITLEDFNPEPGKVIVMRFPFQKYDLDTTKQIFEEIKATFPDNIVVGFPDDMTLQDYTKEDFQKRYLKL